LQCVNLTPLNRLPRVLNLQTNRQKKPRENVKENSTRVIPERVNKWPDSMLARWWQWWWWWWWWNM